VGSHHPVQKETRKHEKITKDVGYDTNEYKISNS
jgi:hypothetical protein